MAPDVLRPTPHDAGVLDRTGIISASAAPLPDEFDVPPDAYRPRAHRSRIASCLVVLSMLAVVVTGGTEVRRNHVEVTPVPTNGFRAVDGVPVASTRRSSPPPAAEFDESERTTSPTARPLSSRENPVPSVSARPSFRQVPRAVLPTHTERPDPIDVLHDESRESAGRPSAEPVEPSTVGLPVTVTQAGSLSDEERLRARGDEEPGDGPREAPASEGE